MQNDYTFLTDHSYSIRVDYDKLSLKQRQTKAKRPRAISKRSNKSDRTVSIHRSSSDKENNSSSPTVTKTKPPVKKKTIGSRRQSVKKSNTTTASKSINAMKKKRNVNKPSVSYSTDPKSISPSLSIEERVKLRRTKPILTVTKPKLNKKTLPIKRIHVSKSKKSVIKPKKFFLGSGLDLDNIVLGNRQRRSIQS